MLFKSFPIVFMKKTQFVKYLPKTQIVLHVLESLRFYFSAACRYSLRT